MVVGDGKMKRKLTVFLAASLIASFGLSSISQADDAPISCEGTTIDQCALLVKGVLSNTATTPEAAIQAWGSWAERYEKAYREMDDAPVPPSDLERFENAVSDRIDSFTNPASVALDLAIKKYFPRLASIFAFAEGAVVTSAMVFLSPSPIVTPIQELQSTNDDLSRLLRIKLSPWLRHDWRQRYSGIIQTALDDLALPKP